MILFYDSKCPLCRRFRDAVEHWDRNKSVDLIDLHAHDTGDRYPQLDLPAALEQLTVMESGEQEVHRGAAALKRLADVLPGIRRLSWVYQLPGVTPAVNRVYNAVQRRRKQLCLKCGQKWMPSLKASRRRRGT